MTPRFFRPAAILASLLIAIPAVTLASPESPADDTYPSKPVRLIVPYAAGGGLGGIAQKLSLRMADVLGQPVVVEYKPGAGTTIGTNYVARSAPDGYTLLITLAAFATTPSLYASLPYDVARDFAPVILLSSSTSVLAVNPRLPIKTFDELRDYAAHKPGGVNYASTGLGGDMHLTVASLFRDAGINATHIPFNGGNPAINAVIAGNVDVMLVPPSLGLQQIVEGRLRPIAVTTPQRWKTQLTDVPTLAESGVKVVDINGWAGVLAPANTPANVVAKLNRTINGILDEKDFRSFLATVFHDPIGGQPDVLGARVAADAQRWKSVVAQIGLKPQ